jgi:RyR domain
MAGDPQQLPLVEKVARVTYAAYSAWAEVNGEQPEPPWEQADEGQREAARQGVRQTLAGSNAEQVHEIWVQHKLAAGWTSGETKDLARKTDPAVKPYSQLTSMQKRVPHMIAAITRALACGKERWAVKTMTDPDAATVNLTPVQKEIMDLIALPAPAAPLGRVDGEFTTYQLTGTISLAKMENDSDIHMVINDAAGNHMIIESTSPGCAQGSVVADQIATARQAVERQFPDVADGGRQENIAVPVTVTGVAFFDHPHGQTGAAANNIELHPLLSFEVAASP